MTSIKTKKLLVVSTSFPMKQGDGLSPFILEFCLHLSRLGWDVTALVPHHKGLKDRELWDGVTVRRFRYLPESLEDVGYSGGIMPNIKKRPWRVLKMPPYVYSMYREALKIAVDEKFDLVSFQWLFPASFWLRSFIRSSGLPVVLTGHGTDIHLATKGIFKKFANRALKKADALTVNSNYMKSILKDNILPPRAEVIYVGSDSVKFYPGPTKPSESKTILYVGRLIKQKGIDLLVEAFVEIVKQVPDAKLEIIGYGPEKESIQAILRSNNLEKSVTMVDAVPHDALPQIYGRSRVLLLPALIPEGLGMTPAEAGLCGVPTLTFGLGGTKEIVINGKTGLIVEPTREALRGGLLKLLTDDALVDELGRNAREFLLDVISWPQIAQKFDKLFCDVVEDHKSKIKPPMTGATGWIAALLIFSITFGYIIKTFIDRFERIVSLLR
jgi:glycosyltransferase involved in cell wall biosynthesis